MIDIPAKNVPGRSRRHDDGSTVSAWLPQDVRRALRQAAADRNMSVSELIGEILRQWVASTPRGYPVDVPMR